MAGGKPTEQHAESNWKHMRKQFFIAVGMSFVLLQVLFLGNMAYLSATQFENTGRAHNLNVLFVDFDGGVVGQSVVAAYSALKGDSFPTLETQPSSSYASPKAVRNAVCSGDYWGAVYASSGASTRLSSQLSGEASTSNETALTYIWNGARYPAFSQSMVYSNLQILVSAARSAFYGLNGTSALGLVTAAQSETSLEAFTNPITATEINLKETTQGARVLYNTVGMVMPILQQFFYLMALNGISAQFHVLTKFGVVANGLLRMCVSLLYTFVGSMCTVAYIWSFKESWSVNGNQFVLSWMIIWLFMHINFAVIDALTAFVPMQFMPFCILTWIIINVASSLSPLELSPGFFRWGHALPANETYQVLVQIWSDGCENRLYRALPILFSWWVVGLSLAVYSMHYRVAKALAAEKAASENDSSEAASENVSSEQSENVDPANLATKMETNQPDMPHHPHHHITEESLRLEQSAYGPSYPTPFVHGDR